jgi:hypothetical protein
MSDTDRLNSEYLVEVHKARGEWEGNLLVGYLRDNGVEATLQEPASIAPLDSAETMTGTDKVCGIFVLDHDRKKASELVKEFLSAAADDSVLEETAAEQLHVDKEKIARLRGELQEERKTFEFLAWSGVMFLGAASLLWATWPAWLKVEPPAPEFRWVMVILLALGAVMAGAWSSRSS